MMQVEQTPHHTRKIEIGAAGAALLLALLLRIWFFVSGRVILDADECYLAIQGLDILKGHGHVFFYGQNYMGCLEAYGFALVRLILGASTPLAVQILATAQALLYLITSYWLVRRFFGFQAALAVLLLLALPPGMLAIWLGKIRGYLPWLILGNAILCLVLRLHEQAAAARSRLTFWALGVLMGIAWWANPLALYHIVTVALFLVLSPRLRRLTWSGSFRSLPAALVNGLALVILIVLESRSLFDARQLPALRYLMEQRVLVLGAASLLAACVAALAWRWRTRPYHPALLSCGFITGNAPALWVVWSVADLNLKQGVGNLASLPGKFFYAVMNDFPAMAGLLDISQPERQPYFGLAVNLFVVLVYVCAVYGALRGLKRTGAPLALMLALIGVTLMIFWLSSLSLYGVERYLLGLYLPFFVLLALLVKDLNGMARGLGWGVLACLLAVHLAGNRRLPTHAVQLPDGIQQDERAILQYAAEHALDVALIEGSDDMAMRLTLFSDARTIFFNPRGYSNRIEQHKQRFRERNAYTLLANAEAGGEDAIGRPADGRVGHFAVYHEVPGTLITQVYGEGFLR